MSRVERIEDTSVSLFDSIKLERRTNRAKYENAADNLKKHGDDMQDMRQ
jgi:hypothetical protein